MGPGRPATWDAVGPIGSGLGLVNVDGILDEIEMSFACASVRQHQHADVQRQCPAENVRCAHTSRKGIMTMDYAYNSTIVKWKLVAYAYKVICTDACKQLTN